MVDTGWQSHPCFADRGYRVDPTVLGPGTVDPTVDENGHGTGESANIFATAPDCTLQPVKTATASGALVNTTAAFNAASALNPDIITNSWTRNIQFGPLSAALQALAAAVAARGRRGSSSSSRPATATGASPASTPTSSPSAASTSAGRLAARVGLLERLHLERRIPGRRVPDVSGLVGMRPGAQYIMLPLPEGCTIDTSYAGGSHPNGDETGNERRLGGVQRHVGGAARRSPASARSSSRPART